MLRSIIDSIIIISAQRVFKVFITAIMIVGQSASELYEKVSSSCVIIKADIPSMFLGWSISGPFFYNSSR